MPGMPSTKKDLQEFLEVVGDLAEELGLQDIAKSVRRHGKALDSKITFDSKVDELEFSTRVTYCLMNLQVTYVGELVQYTREELFRGKNLGEKSLREIEEVLAYHGMGLGTWYYLEDLDRAGWKRPDGEVAEDYCRYLRTRRALQNPIT